MRAAKESEESEGEMTDDREGEYLICNITYFDRWKLKQQCKFAADGLKPVKNGSNALSIVNKTSCVQKKDSRSPSQLVTSSVVEELCCNYSSAHFQPQSSEYTEKQFTMSHMDIINKTNCYIYEQESVLFPQTRGILLCLLTVLRVILLNK